MEKEWMRKIVFATILVLLALVCSFALPKRVASPEKNEEIIQYLDEKKDTVMRLTAASTATSVAITFLPDDWANPIAEKLVDLSTGFLVVLSAIYLEKYLLAILSYAAYKVVIPLALGLWALWQFWKNENIYKFAWKLFVLGAAMILLVPTGVKTSRMIEDIYRDSVQATIAAAENASEEVEFDNAEENKDQGLLSGIVSGIKNTVSEKTKQFENVLNRFVEALAVLLVTSCLIPILVLLAFVWLFKMFVGIGINFNFSELVRGKHIFSKQIPEN